MRQTIRELAEELETTLIATRRLWDQQDINSDDVPAISRGSTSATRISFHEIQDVITDLIRTLGQVKEEELGEAADYLRMYSNRLSSLRATHNGVPPLSHEVADIYLQQFAGIKRQLEPVISVKLGLDAQRLETVELVKENKRLKAVLAATAKRIEYLDTSSQDFEEKVRAVQNAYDSAVKLDTEMTDLQIEKGAIQTIGEQVKKISSDIQAELSQATAVSVAMAALNSQAESVLARADAGYRAVTSQGLAAAFQRRSMWASASMVGWTLGLVLALVIGGLESKERMTELLMLTMNGSPSNLVVSLQAIWLLLTTAGTVWFAWLASLQIGYRFRLAEDYAYKASISSAYEGYRREAERVDDGLARQLLASALARLDEVPLRVVDPKVHGSPVQALVDSDAVKQVTGILPTIMSKITKRAETAPSATKGASAAAAEPEGKA